MTRKGSMWLGVFAATLASQALAQPSDAPPPPPPAAAPSEPAPPASPAPPSAAVQPAPAETISPPAPPPGPPPAAAPTGEAAQVLALIQNVCIPLIQKQDIKAVAQTNGLKRSGDRLVLQLAGVERITISPPTQANPTVCTLTVNHQIDQSKPIVDALTGWAAAQNPPVPPLSAGYQASPGMLGWSWALDTNQMHEGLVLTVQKTPDGKPLGKGYDVSTVLFSRSDH